MIKHLHTRPAEKKKKSWKARLIIFFILVCVGAFVYVANLSEYQIKGIEVSGATLTNESKVREIASANIQNRYLFAIPKSFVWLYPKFKIKKEIESMLSVLDTRISIDGENDLQISLIERPQKYLWCRDPNSSSECFYMDDKGMVFIAAPSLEGGVFVKFSGLITNDPIGQNFLEKNKMASLVSFMNSILDLGFVPKAISAVSLSEIHIILSSGTDMIISLEKPLDSVLANLQILKQSPDFTNASGGIEKLQYIDLRYGTKAFWK